MGNLEFCGGVYGVTRFGKMIMGYEPNALGNQRNNPKQTFRNQFSQPNENMWKSISFPRNSFSVAGEFLALVTVGHQNDLSRQWKNQLTSTSRRWWTSEAWVMDRIILNLRQGPRTNVEHSTILSGLFLHKTHDSLLFLFMISWFHYW